MSIARDSIRGPRPFDKPGHSATICNVVAPSSSGLGRWPLKPETGIRIPLGPPQLQFQGLPSVSPESPFFVFGLDRELENSRACFANLQEDSL